MKKSILLMLSTITLAINAKASNILVAYFSWSGNTQALAMEIQSQTNADIYRIEPATPYTTNYRELAYTVALNEKNNNSRPALKDTTLDLTGYDYIFVGCPVWWSDAPMIIHSFLEQYDFSGKTIIPFCTYASGAGGTLNDIVEATPNSQHLSGRGFRGSSSYSSSSIASWLEEIGIDDIVSGIENVNTKLSAKSEKIYDISGRMMKEIKDTKNLAPGIYVKKGKKFIVRQ